MRIWIVRTALRLVPFDWRTAVAEDLQEAAEEANHGPIWLAWHAGRAGVSLRTARFVDGTRFDLQCAMRSLAKSPWFTCGALLTFALGIGVNVAVFTAVDRVLFRQLPYERPDEIMVMREVGGNGQPFGTMPAAIAAAAREQHRGFVDLSVAFSTGEFSTSRESDDIEPLRLTQASYNTLELFGVRVVRGRDFTKDDDRQKRRVALVSFDAWRTRFGAAHDAVGRQLWSDGNAAEIVGILPERFIPASNFLDPRSDGFVLMPMDISPAPTARLFSPYVRLRPGVSLEAAQAELDVLAEAVRRELPKRPNAQPTRIALAPLRSVLFSRYTTFLWLVTIAAALVLAIACANLGSLMLVRNRSREHLAATQIALGASSGRLMRAGLIESGLLSFGATCVALLAIHWTNAVLRSALPDVFSRYAAPVTDPRVLMFALLTALACTGVAGAYPSWRIARVDVLGLLQRGSVSARSGRVRGSRSLLTVEAALTVLLVAGAMMTVRSLVTLSRTDLGFNPRNLYNVNVIWPPGLDSAARFRQAMLTAEALTSVPGVIASGGADINPLSGFLPMRGLAQDLPGTGRWQVTDQFFSSMGMRMLAGRAMSAVEVANDAPVAALSESGLRTVMPGVTPTAAIGQRLRVAGEPDRTVVGIVSDVRAVHAASSMPSLYLPLSDKEFRLAMFVVRMSPNTAPLPSLLRAHLREAGVAASTVTVRGVEAELADGLGNQRFRAVLFSAFGLTALILAAVGLYAVGAYEAAQRRREVGIRMAIGGSARAVQWLIVRQAMAPVIVGLAVGLAVAYWAAKFLQAFLHQVDARDPAHFALVVLVLMSATAIAAWLPAHQASRFDPTTVLRAH
jgi:predicted permease